MRNQVVVAAAVGTTVTVVVIGALIRRWKLMKEQQLKHAKNIIRKFARECATPVAKLWQVADDLVSQMKASLDSPSSDETSSSSTLNMIISNVTALPNGDEEGLFYGVNVHGTNLLILRAKLGGKNKPICDLQREEISIPPHVLAGSSMEITDFVVTEIAKFVSSHPVIDEDENSQKKMNLGFTLSFPVDTTLPFTSTTFQRKSPNDPVHDEMTHGIDGLEEEDTSAMTRRGQITVNTWLDLIKEDRLDWSD
ncbi:hypothetical protein PIB30_020322 [Stylosanthes scabra]|uniref:Phosphotransferase n=1 Tax=Stylosanthes scabra TaxID=79078 RepID=A0ABU6X9X5_9FABA|nr:hypothetical protein [Stylosanthes scabra]